MKTLKTILFILTVLINITVCLTLIKKISEEVSADETDYYMK